MLYFKAFKGFLNLGGFMESLDKEWIFHGNIQQCEQFEKTPNTLGLKNMAGVFILVGAGIIGGIGLIIIEVVYKKHQIKKNKRLEIARHAADKWRGTIEVCISSVNLFTIEICSKTTRYSYLFIITEKKNIESITCYAKAVQCGLKFGSKNYKFCCRSQSLRSPIRTNHSYWTRKSMAR